MKKGTLGLTVAGALFCSSFLASANGIVALTNQPGSRLTRLSSKVSATEDHASPLPWSEIGAQAGADYHGDGLSVTAAGLGARLRCAFQRLEGEATTEGLWLVSTATNAGGTAHDRFRVMASSVGRVADAGNSEEPPGLGLRQSSGAFPPAARFQKRSRWIGTAVQNALALPPTGTVQVADKLIRFARPGLIEEYSVSVDGVRQDFVIEKRPEGSGELRVTLAVDGARVEAAMGGAQLVLENSGRKIAYSRLRVTDATGRELTSRMEVSEKSEIGLAVVANDAEAVYPVRIDPTFSDANWISMNPSIPGTDSYVYEAVVDDSGNLYIGGNFTVAGDVIANRIAKWNGSGWSTLGSGMNGHVQALAVSGSDLYAGGNFTNAGGSAANYIAKWNGSSWSALGSGMNSAVNALAVSGGDLYAGGPFTNAGGLQANRIAKWNGSSWSALGSGMGGVSYPAVSALAVSGTDLYVGGDFTDAGGIQVSRIAKWDGSSWTSLGSGMGGYDPRVYTLAVSGSNLYAGGTFTRATNGDWQAVTANYIAKWNGSSWSALGSGMNGHVQALVVSGSNVYAGGEFTMATNGGGLAIAAKRIAKWDGSTWNALGSGMGNNVYPDVYALAVSGSDLYAGGGFQTAGGSGANYIAQWNGNSWSALGSGMNNWVSEIVVSGSDLYVGGDFTTTGDSAANRVAKWNGSSWTALGSGMNDTVHALAVSGSDLYAGGDFTNAGGTAANYIAKWNGNSWSALGSGMGGVSYPTVFALAVSGSDLYAGGDFTDAGGTAANYIARWNGSSWSTLGSGMNYSVRALAVSGSDLYAGEPFTNAGGSAASHIAKWNGSTWSALGSGINWWGVHALAVSGSDLYAGGLFTAAGGSAANYIAKWNGSSWTNLGSGMNYPVVALAVSGSDLYAGGEFTTAGGSAANRIAKWNGSSWSALGSGMNDDVSALAVSGSDLYAGGSFTIAGKKVSGFVARAYPELPALFIFRSGDDVTLSWPTFYETFSLQQNPNVANTNGWSPGNYPLSTNGATKSASVPLTPTNQFFRLIEN